MKLKISIAACLSITIAAPVAADETQDLAAEGGQVITQLGGTLLSELQAAMRSGGPVAAVDFCSLEAQQITYGVSDASEGWEISRSSHRLRNPANAPDAYTSDVIADFLTRAENGESIETLVRAEILEEDNQRMFRMTRAIPTVGACLTCHGVSEVSPEVEAILFDLYPEDEARGFSEGDMRGVFVLNKVLD